LPLPLLLGEVDSDNGPGSRAWADDRADGITSRLAWLAWASARGGMITMSRHIARALGAALSGLAVTAAGLSSAEAAAPLTASHSMTAPAAARPAAASGAQLWVRRYNGPGNGADVASAVAVSPGGHQVFVTGASTGTATGRDYATVAYNAATGKRLWASRYNGPGNGADSASAVAVSPDGATVYVTGGSEGIATQRDYATVAYNAATGAQLWASRYNGPGDSNDSARSVAVSPRGGTVFVTGSVYWSSWSKVSADTTPGNYCGTVAYSAATGAELWVRLYPKNGNGYSMAYALTVSPRGGRVLVAGRPDTLAYNFSGKLLWASRYPGSDPQSVAVSRAGDRAFVTGYNQGDYGTVAYNAVTGARLWASRYNGPGNSDDWAYSVAVNPAGTKVYVTGHSGGGYATVAYNAATGARIWVRRYNGPYHPSALAVSPGGSRVFVACTSRGDYTTIAYTS